ncbi:MAG: GYF domain-containing protein [Candidatus Hydrogenedentota bacterium]
MFLLDIIIVTAFFRGGFIMADEYFLYSDGKQEGPYTIDVIKGLIKNGSLRKEDYIWKEGLAEWVLINELPEFGDAFAQETKTEQPAVPQPQITEEKKEVKEIKEKRFISVKTTIGVIALLLIAGVSYATFYFRDDISAIFEKSKDYKYIKLYPDSTLIYISGKNILPYVNNFKKSNFYKSIDPLIKSKSETTQSKDSDLFNMFLETTTGEFSLGFYPNKARLELLYCGKVKDTDMKRYKELLKKKELKIEKIGGLKVYIYKDIPVIDMQKLSEVLGPLSMQNQMKITMDLNTINTAIKAYYNNNGVYPSEEEGLNILIEENYLEILLIDPWGKDYKYSVKEDGTYKISVEYNNKEIAYLDSTKGAPQFVLTDKPEQMLGKGDLYICLKSQNLFLTSDRDNFTNAFLKRAEGSVTLLEKKYTESLKKINADEKVVSTLYIGLNKLGEFFEESLTEDLVKQFKTAIEVYKAFDFSIIAATIDEELILDAYSQLSKDAPEYIRNLYKKGESKELNTAKYLPQNSILCFTTNSWNYEAWKEYVVTLFSSNPMQVEFFKAQIEKCKQNFGIDIDKVLKKILTSDCSFAISKITQEGVIPLVNIIIASKINEGENPTQTLKELFKNLSKLAKNQIKVAEEKINGSKVTIMKTQLGDAITPCFTENNGFLLFSISKDSLKSCLETFANGESILKNQYVIKLNDFEKSSAIAVIDIGTLLAQVENIAAGYKALFSKGEENFYERRFKPCLTLVSAVSALATASFYEEEGIKQQTILFFKDLAEPVKFE